MKMKAGSVATRCDQVGRNTGKTGIPAKKSSRSGYACALGFHSDSYLLPPYLAQNVPKRYHTAMKSFPYHFLFACIAVALCLAVVETVSAQTERKGINLFERNKTTNTPRREIQRPANNQIITAMQSVADNEKRHNDNRRMLFYYSLFLAGVIAVAVCLVYWQHRRRKQTEWELNDPMALVKELNFAHQLSEQEKRLMQEVSSKNTLSSPLQLFVEPKFLLDVWEDDSFVSSQPLVRRLLSKLFDIAVGGGEGVRSQESGV